MFKKKFDTFVISFGYLFSSNLFIFTFTYPCYVFSHYFILPYLLHNTYKQFRVLFWYENLSLGVTFFHRKIPNYIAILFILIEENGHKIILDRIRIPWASVEQLWQANNRLQPSKQRWFARRILRYSLTCLSNTHSLDI